MHEKTAILLDDRGLIGVIGGGAYRQGTSAVYNGRERWGRRR